MAKRSQSYSAEGGHESTGLPGMERCSGGGGGRGGRSQKKGLLPSSEPPHLDAAQRRGDGGGCPVREGRVGPEVKPRRPRERGRSGRRVRFPRCDDRVEDHRVVGDGDRGGDRRGDGGGRGRGEGCAGEGHLVEGRQQRRARVGVDARERAQEVHLQKKSREKKRKVRQRVRMHLRNCKAHELSGNSIKQWGHPPFAPAHLLRRRRRRVGDVVASSGLWANSIKRWEHLLQTLQSTCCVAVDVDVVSAMLLLM